jgi:hypothetical protein
VLAHPTAPWEAAHSATQRPWASALDFACLTAKGARSANAALTAITQKLFSGMGFRYDTIWGSPSYCGHWSKGFHLTNYLRRKRVKVNCYDQAYGVVTLGNLLGTVTRIAEIEPFGFLDGTDLVGVGFCNNPLFDGPERIKIQVYNEGKVEEAVAHISRMALTGVDSVDRSRFDRHAFAVSEGVVFDACAGPAFGEYSVSNYIERVVDHSTGNECLNGYFSERNPGTVNTRSPSFVLE